MPPTRTPDERADVELRVPADSVYVSVLRTTTASLSARLDFTIDDIEDLRIAVGEACAMVLPEADPGTDLVAEYFLGAGRLTVRVSVSGSDIGTPDYDSFAWQVLDTLAGGAAAEVADGRFVVSLSMESETLSSRL
ncbi:anti-sigma factor [Nocardioides sp.]|uniref:anti-sigma factor n=1 Tax=Nocardioides sp. TaxID=35761 RepID=UPI002ED36DEF